ncbi:MAG: SpoIIE family protein phosphatase [Gemmataceae bacterium]|nr:SpoIIE family protein phosphatase [Gemmataceae bacterium]
MAHLRTLVGPNQGATLALDRDKSVLGRAKECHIQLESAAGRVTMDGGSGGKHENTVSRKHAVITRDQGQYYIEDGDGKGAKSRNGTFVNGARVPFPERVPLKDKDVIKICDVELQFECDDSDSSSTIDAAISHDDSSQFLAGPAEKLQRLLEFSNRLSHTLDLEPLLPVVVESLLQLFKQADRVFLILVDETSGELDPRIVRSRRSEEEPRPRFSASIVRKCLAHVQALLSNNVAEQFPTSDSVAGLSLRSVMCAPLWTQQGKAFGVLLVDSTNKKRKFTQEDLALLMGVASQASIALTNARFHRDALARERLNRDLALAREVARSFLPAQLPQVGGYEFFARNESALAVGGDYYDFVPLGGNRLGILLGDVTGKGVAAALVMARFSAQACACLRAEAELTDAVAALNGLMQPLALADRFMTLAALTLDADSHTVTMVNAGHPEPLVLRRATGAVESANADSVIGVPLGVIDDYEYEAHQITLQPGDNLIVFSDGVTEALDKNGRQFGIKRLRQQMEQAVASPRELGERILRAVEQHAAGCSQFDDITLVCLGRTG